MFESAGENLIFWVIGIAITVVILFKIGIMSPVIGEVVKGAIGWVVSAGQWIILLFVFFVRSHHSFLYHLLSKRESLMIREKIEDTNKNGGK